jgi:hypothetical protein
LLTDLFSSSYFKCIGKLLSIDPLPSGSAEKMIKNSRKTARNGLKIETTEGFAPPGSWFDPPANGPLDPPLKIKTL